MLKKSSFLFVLVCSLLVGCSNGTVEKSRQRGPLIVSKTHSGPYPIRAICTTGMVADLVKNVGGERVVVEQLMGQGVDPHLYKTSRGDIRKLESADVIFYSGLHLEGKMTEIFDALEKSRPTFPVAEYIPELSVLENEEKSHDPHVWFDVELWRQAAGVVLEVLKKYDPPHATEYQSRFDIYQAELRKLHAYAKEQLASIPTERRVLVTAHDAFRYFGRAYDIEVKGIQGISTEAEAGVKDINDLVNFIAVRKIKAVFVESSVNPRNIQSLVQGCAAQGHKVVVGGELYSDAMGKEGEPEGTYIGMVRHNVDTIVHALK